MMRPPSIQLEPVSCNRLKTGGFTLIEIALCLAVVGFALVAIIGVLPLGMQVQKENREDTIVSQDGAYFLEAIRNGVRGLDHLANYVETIYHTRLSGANLVTSQIHIDNGASVIGRLADPTLVRSEAIVRPLAGYASDNGSNSGVEAGFRYGLFVEVLPFDSLSTNDMPSALVRSMQTNLHELRLTIRYPLISTVPTNKYGPGKQVFRTMVGGKIESTPEGYYFQPANFSLLP